MTHEHDGRRRAKVLRYIERERARLSTRRLRCEGCGDEFAASYGTDRCEGCAKEARKIAALELRGAIR